MHTKSELRKEFLQKRREIPSEIKEQWDARIFENLQRFSPLRDARCIMTYVSFNKEVDTRRLIEFLLSHGKRVAIPQTDPTAHTIAPGEIFNLEEDICPGPFKIPEPPVERFRLVDIREIQIHIVPGIVFDLRGHRLGYSGGFYDRFLATVPENVPTVGLAFESQIVDFLPIDPWDINVKFIVSEKRIVNCGEESQLK